MELNGLIGSSKFKESWKYNLRSNNQERVPIRAIIQNE